MKVLRLPVEADLSESALLAAMEVMDAAGEAGPFLSIDVAPERMFAAKRLLADFAQRDPMRLALHTLGRAGDVRINYAWSGEGRDRWMLHGRDHVVFSTGGGS